MLYYRVKPDYDQTPRIRFHRKIEKQTRDGVFVADELYTPRELDKFDIPVRLFYEMFEPVRVRKTDTYWFFGCRFEKGVTWNDR